MNHDIKELLTLAAKACGYEVRHDIETKDCIALADPEGYLGNEYSYWAPHADDGDCFRMETELSLNVGWFEKFAFVYSPTSSDNQVVEIFSNHNGDKNAARRLASFRVAAELGRRMP